MWTLYIDSIEKGIEENGDHFFKKYYIIHEKKLLFADYENGSPFLSDMVTRHRLIR